MEAGPSEIGDERLLGLKVGMSYFVPSKYKARSGFDKIFFKDFRPVACTLQRITSTRLKFYHKNFPTFYVLKMELILSEL